jgi:hypothetical protein
MNPYLLGLTAQEHTAELRRAAERHRVTGPDRPHDTMRSRAGWALVHIGLRLAASPAAARSAAAATSAHG